MALYVGTSGWAYPEWRPGFYPASLPQTAFLSHYADCLRACEINATFYRLQSEATIARWAEATPPTFRFATKAHRRITHGAVPDAQGAFLATFLHQVAGLGPRLGVVLFQYPPSRPRDDAVLAALIAALPRELPFALEFRHDSWRECEVEERVTEAGGTICLSETLGEVPERLPAGRLAYVRLRADRYSPTAREGWRSLLERESTGRDVFAFAKHEGIPAGDPFGGVGLAQWLMAGAG